MYRCNYPCLYLHFLIILLCLGGFPGIIDSGERWLTVESESSQMSLSHHKSCIMCIFNYISVNLIRNWIAVHLGFTSLRANPVHKQHLKLFSNCL